MTFRYGIEALLHAGIALNNIFEFYTFKPLILYFR